MAQSGYYDRDRRPKTSAGLADSWTGDEPVGQMNYAPPHHSSTAEYQSSGIPFVHSKEIGESDTVVHVFSFPYVTRWLMIQIVDGADLVTLEPKVKIAFSNGGTALDGAQYVNSQLTNNQRLELKCTKVYVLAPSTGSSLGGGSNKGMVQIIAGLTGVPAADFPNMTGTSAAIGDLPGINANTGIATTTTLAS